MTPFHKSPATDSADQFATPQAIQGRRRLAQALMQNGVDTSPVMHWSQAAARVAQALSGRMNMDYADASEREGQSAGRRALIKALGGGGYDDAMSNPYSADQALQMQIANRNQAASRGEQERMLRLRQQIEQQSPEYQMNLDWKREQIEASKAERAAKAAKQQQELDFIKQFDGPTAGPPSTMPPPMRLGGPMQQGAARGPVMAAQAASRVAQAPGPQSYDMAPEPQQMPRQPSSGNRAPMTARQVFDQLTPEDQATGRLLLQSGDTEGFVKLLQTSGADAARVKRLEEIGLDPNSAEGQTFRATGKLPAAAYQQISLNQRRKTQAKGIMRGLSNLNRATTDYNDAAFTNALGPIQGAEPGWLGTPFTAVARGFGEAANAVEGGNATPNEVRNSINGSTEALAAAIKPLIRAPGEGPWTDADQARLVAIVGDLAQSSTKDEYRRRLNGVADRVRTNFNLDIPFDAFETAPPQARQAAPTGGWVEIGGGVRVREKR